MVTIPRDPAEIGVSRAVARLRLRAERRIAWLQTLARADRPIDRGDDPEAEKRFRASDDLARSLGEAIAGVESEADPAAASGSGDRLAQLAGIFNLDRRELDLVEGCLAAELDPSMGRLFAVLADHAARVYPTEAVLSRLYDHGLHRVLTPEAPLSRWRIVHAEPVAAGEPDALRIDPLLRDWLVGQHRLDEALVGVAHLVAPRPPLPHWQVDRLTAWIQDAVRSGAWVRVRIVGSPGSGRRTLATCAAERLGLPLLAIDSDAVSEEAWPQVVLAAHRQAYLDGCAIAWTGDAAISRRWPDLPASFPIQFLVSEVGPAPAPIPDAIDHTVEMPALEVAERAAMWRLHVPGASSWTDDELAALAAHHRLTPGEIRSIGARRPGGAAEAGELVRETSRHRLGELARWMESPFAWDDLVVPPSIRDALEDLVYEARHRATFWEQAAARRLFPQGRGLFALFTGNPGTGKTMAAQVVSAALGLDLFRISLATVVSKYVGETSKNLHRILARAEEMDAVLLFDEADALFGKRTEIKDAHDRFANTDTNYLLQAIEAYRGIAILASNKKANIDPAFTRRLRWVLEFPRPDVSHRRILWTRLVGELAGPSRAEELSTRLDAVASTVEITGAQIKYAVLAALFAAQREGCELAPRHLVRGIERELLKEGRALSDRDRDRIARASARVDDMSPKAIGDA